MNVLGISSFYHDSAASLLRNGELVAAAEEERFNREKHSSKFPVNAINYCLQEENLTVRDIDYVGFYEKPYLKFERSIVNHLRSYPFSLSNFLREIPNWLDDRLTVPLKLEEEIGYKGDVLFIPHHLSHASSAFYPSSFQNAAIITSDGVGEWVTTTLGVGNRNGIHIFEELEYPNSLGLLYSAITTFLGFRANYDEGKVMGLSSYGNPTYREEFEDMVSMKDDGSFELDRSYFNFIEGDKMYSDNLVDILGSPREFEEEIEQRHKDIAATLQLTIEDILLKMCDRVYEETQLDNLCLAGGTFLNCKANKRIREESDFKNIFVQPAAADSGGSIGAALYIYSSVFGNDVGVDFRKEGIYLGPQFSNRDIKRTLEVRDVEFREMVDKNLLEFTAKKLNENKVIGWFQGRMEFGPRSLGNRSILANPGNPKMRDIINKKVKHREEFRPFAPSILAERGKRYGINEDLPFMIQNVDIENNIEEIKSATHVDETSRPHIVSKERNRLYYNLIKEFEKITGIPALLNTSFNDSGDPIVRTPEEAYECFRKIKIDYLILGNYVISDKKEIK